MIKNQSIDFTSPFRCVRPQSTTFSKERNVATINHGIGRHVQSTVSSLLCRKNILMLKKRQTSSLKIMMRYFIECRKYWDNALQASLPSFKPIHYRMESGDYVAHGWDVPSIKAEITPIRRIDIEMPARHNMAIAD